MLTVFSLLGINIIYHAWKGEEEDESPSTTPLGFLALMAVGIATAIDALAVGGCMALGQMCGDNLSFLQVCEAAGIIGIITFLCSEAAFHAARSLQKLPTRRLETAAGLLLIGLGIYNL